MTEQSLEPEETGADKRRADLLPEPEYADVPELMDTQLLQSDGEPPELTGHLITLPDPEIVIERAARDAMRSFGLSYPMARDLALAAAASLQEPAPMTPADKERYLQEEANGRNRHERRRAAKLQRRRVL